MMQGTLNTEQFLSLVGRRLRYDTLSTRDFVILSHLYADVAGMKKKPRNPRGPNKKKIPVELKPEPTMDEVILQLEKDSKHGQ